jgi:hypothetical protein
MQTRIADSLFLIRIPDPRRPPSAHGREFNVLLNAIADAEQNEGSDSDEVNCAMIKKAAYRYCH